jgi:hypothetical protein
MEFTGEFADSEPTVQTSVGPVAATALRLPYTTGDGTKPHVAPLKRSMNGVWAIVNCPTAQASDRESNARPFTWPHAAFKAATGVGAPEQTAAAAPAGLGAKTAKKGAAAKANVLAIAATDRQGMRNPQYGVVSSI